MTGEQQERYEVCQPSPEGTQIIGQESTFTAANRIANRIPNAEIYDRTMHKWLALEPACLGPEGACCEPSGEMVGTLRDALREFAGVEVAPGMVRVALTAALMAEHERRDHKEPTGDRSDPREDADACR